MDDSIWMKLLYALPLVLIAIFMFPRARHMIQNSPKAQNGDWKAVAIPLVMVILVIVLLVKLS